MTEQNVDCPYNIMTYISDSISKESGQEKQTRHSSLHGMIPFKWNV